MTDRWSGLLGPEEREAVCQRHRPVGERELADGAALVAVDRQAGGDPVTGAPRWYLRLRGEEKEFVTVWLTLRQRTLHHETQFMPGPETNVEATWEYLLKRNADLLGMAFALGPEDAVYLVGRVPVERVDDEELDRIMGASLAYTDECFPTAMSIGYEGRYRRRPPSARVPGVTRPTRRPWPGGEPAGVRATSRRRSAPVDPRARRGPAGSVSAHGTEARGRRGRPDGFDAVGRADLGGLGRSRGPGGERARRRPAPEAVEDHPGLLVAEGPVAADAAVLAVKPDVAEAVARTLSAVGITRVLSIVAGLSSARLEAALQPGDVVVRSMPNTPALIGAGVSAMSGGSAATAADLDWAEGILGTVGTVVRLPERHLDAVTGLSGSGPAYVFLVAEALIEAGVTAGLSREVSRQLVVGTVLGSARMMTETGDDPAALRAAVTSPGGTTAATVRTLEFKAVRSAFIEAVAAATERSRQLGR